MRIILLAILCVGCTPKYYNVFNAHQLMNSIHIIELRAEVQMGEEWIEISQRGGTSFSIGNGYSLALTHATTFPDGCLIPPQGGAIIAHNTSRNHTYWINGEQIELIGRVGDVSLFLKPWEDEYPLTLGHDPIIGTELIIIGNSMLNGINLKTGITSRMDTGIFNVPHSFVHTTPTNRGDSGSPVLAKRGAFYEVVGIVNAGVLQAQGYSFAIKISHIKEVLDELL